MPSPRAKQPRLRRVAVYPLEAVLSQVVFTADGAKVKPRGGRVDLAPFVRHFDGIPVNMTSQRYQLFATKGVRCACCGIEGEFFSLDAEDHGGRVTHHFNLIAIDADGREVLMTKDHILAKSRGGKDTLANYQPMCLPCNMSKGTGHWAAPRVVACPAAAHAAAI